MPSMRTHPYMAAHLSCPTVSSPLRRFLTSFALPVHNQSAGLAFQQGHALWSKFLPTTSSFFFVLSLLFKTLLLRCSSFRWTFPTRSSLTLWDLSCFELYLRMPDVSKHLWCVIADSPGKNHIKYPYQFACYFHEWLHFFQRIFISGSIILVELSNFLILPHHGYDRLNQEISQALMSPFTYPCLPVVLARTIRRQFHSCQLLQFFASLKRMMSPVSAIKPISVAIPMPFISSNLSAYLIYAHSSLIKSLPKTFCVECMIFY